MRDLWARLLSSDYMPHGHCYLWEPLLVLLQTLSNLAIGLAYMSISATLALLVRHIRGLPFQWVYLAFGLFIVTCGFTHFMDTWVIWHPHYWVDAVIRIVCAAASVGTALLILPLVPKAAALVRTVRHIDDERENALRRAQQEVRARDVFLATAAHELRTPLTPLRLEIDGLEVMLGVDWVRSAEITPHIASAGRQIQRLERLVAKLLDVSRVTTGRLQLQREEFDLVELVREVRARHAAEIAKSDCEVTLEAAAPVTGSWDRLRIDQVVTNLLMNAITYARAKPILLDVSTTDTLARLRVRDQGAGIRLEDQARIFERFEQVSHEPHTGGLGLGLWLVRAIAEAHGGSVRVESRPGEGACFTVDLPRVTGAAAGGASPNHPNA
jgi:signal transduction histidine kinase